MNRTWQDNATEWVVLGKQGKNVRLALLVACSVKRSMGPASTEKATVTEFAELVGTTPARIMRHLDAWDEAAKQRLCPPSNGMFPADAGRADVQVPTEEQFGAVYDASKSGGRPRASVNEISKRIDMDEDYARTLLDSIRASHPGLIPAQSEAAPIIEDSYPRADGEGRTRSYGKPNNEQRAERLNDRVVQIESMIEGLMNDIRLVKSSPHAPTAVLAEEALARMLRQYLDLIVQRQDAA